MKVVTGLKYSLSMTALDVDFFVRKVRHLSEGDQAHLLIQKERKGFPTMSQCSSKVCGGPWEMPAAFVHARTNLK